MSNPVDWAALRRVFAGLSPSTGDEDDPALALDLAEERAAIMEYDGGLSREQADAYAFRGRT